MRTVVRAVAAELPAAWDAACAVVGGLAIGLVALGLLDATRPLGVFLLALANGSHL